MTERKGEKMTNQISEKELSALNDLLTEEELLIKKFKIFIKKMFVIYCFFDKNLI